MHSQGVQPLSFRALIQESKPLSGSVLDFQIGSTKMPLSVLIKSALINVFTNENRPIFSTGVHVKLQEPNFSASPNPLGIGGGVTVVSHTHLHGGWQWFGGLVGLWQVAASRAQSTVDAQNRYFFIET